jgi:hypothetical protein
VNLALVRKYRSSFTWSSVEVHLAAVRRLTPLHREHDPAPHAVDQVLAQIVRKRVNLASTASDEVNVVGAMLRSRVPGYENHLYHIGNAHVVAAQYLDISKQRTPGLPPLTAMYETFTPARLGGHPFIAIRNDFSGEPAEHPLLAPDPADVLDAMHRHPAVVTPRQPRRAMPFGPHGANVGWERLANLGRFLALQQRSQLLDPVLDLFHNRMSGISHPFRGI